MAEFSESDIEAAKRRVREMKSKAKSFVNDEEQSAEKGRAVSEKQEESKEAVQDNSFVIILALILILSKEGADNKLILALLYLLL